MAGRLVASGASMEKAGRPTTACSPQTKIFTQVLLRREIQHPLLDLHLRPPFLPMLTRQQQPIVAVYRSFWPPSLQGFLKKTEDPAVTSSREAVEMEARIRQEACYQAHVTCHVEQVRKLREERNFSNAELSPPPTRIEQGERPSRYVMGIDVSSSMLRH